MSCSVLFGFVSLPIQIFDDVSLSKHAPAHINRATDFVELILVVVVKSYLQSYLQVPLLTSVSKCQELSEWNRNKEDTNEIEHQQQQQQQYH